MNVRGTLTRLAVAVALAAPMTADAASQVGWVKANRYAKKRSRPTLFYPGNLLDGREKTVFCVERGKAVGTRITIGFKGAAGATEVRIVTGDNRGPAFFKEAARVKTLVFHEAAYQRSITLQDARARQVVSLNPPVRGTEVTIEIKEITGEGELACLTDVVFVAGSKALSGSWMGTALKHSRSRAPLLGVWAAGPEGAAEKFLSLYQDGTFSWVYSPNDPDISGRKIRGDWSASGGRLFLKTSKETIGFTFKRGREEDDLGEKRGVLKLTGGKQDSPLGKIADAYRDRWL